VLALKIMDATESFIASVECVRHCSTLHERAVVQTELHCLSVLRYPRGTETLTQVKTVRSNYAIGRANNTFCLPLFLNCIL